MVWVDVFGDPPVGYVASGVEAALNGLVAVGEAAAIGDDVLHGEAVDVGDGLGGVKDDDTVFVGGDEDAGVVADGVLGRDDTAPFRVIFGHEVGFRFAGFHLRPGWTQCQRFQWRRLV